MEINMTNQLTLNEVNTTELTLKAKNNEANQSKKAENSLWSNITARFWGYTEKTSKCDTSSYDGIL